jgi:hypothetical protein
MLQPVYGLDRRGLLRPAAAGVVGVVLPKGVGIDSGAARIGPPNRPHHLINGDVISSVYTGATA